MKRLILILPAVCLVSLASAQTTPPQRPERPARPLAESGPQTTPAEIAGRLTLFDLDFPGGSPVDLVRAIEKSSGKPLNAIVPVEHAQLKLPPLKMRSVDVAQLFQALEFANRSIVAYTTGFTDYGGANQATRRTVQQASLSYGFRTQGIPTDNSVWYFYYDKPPVPPEEARICRFWQLGPYLGELKVEDITTAVQTGYKLLGEPSPEINFHKDTKLLIAVGEPSKLNLIDSVLRELAFKPSPPPAGSHPEPARGEAAKKP